MKTLTLITLLVCCLVDGGDSLAHDQPLQVYILVGQSNMQGHAHVRTLPHLAMDEDTKPLYDQIVDSNGVPKRIEDVWISSLSSQGVKTGQLTTGFGADENKIGPELTFGITMKERVKQPILIIKTAWGGKSLHTDFRSPSAGPYEFHPAVIARLEQQGKDLDAIRSQKEEATGVFYRQTIDHINKVLSDIESVYGDYNPQVGYELAGLVWFQGWNDLVDTNAYPQRYQADGYDDYRRTLIHWIRDVRKDLSAPNLPIVIGVMGVGGPTQSYSPQKQRYREIHQNFRDAMAAPAQESEFQGSVVAVLTENAWDSELASIIDRDEQLQRELNASNQQDQLEQKRKVTFNARELQILKVGKSNAAFHYLGSSKILGRIGKAFAEQLPSVEDSDKGL